MKGTSPSLEATFRGRQLRGNWVHVAAIRVCSCIRELFAKQVFVIVVNL